MRCLCCNRRSAPRQSSHFITPPHPSFSSFSKTSEVFLLGSDLNFSFNFFLHKFSQRIYPPPLLLPLRKEHPSTGELENIHPFKCKNNYTNIELCCFFSCQEIMNLVVDVFCLCPCFLGISVHFENSLSCIPHWKD